MSTSSISTPSNAQLQQNPVLYESYAPRCASQRSRLSRITDLTAGPENRFRQSMAVGNIATGSTHSNTILSNTSLAFRCIGRSHGEYVTGEEPKNNAEELLYSFLTISGANDPNVFVDYRAIVEQSQSIASTTKKSIAQSLHHSKALKEALVVVLEKSEELQHRHSELLKHSGELALQCERLQQEESILSERSIAVGQPLQHYDTVDAVAVQLGVLFKERNGQALMVVKGLPSLKVDNLEEYTLVLDKVYQAMEYFIITASQNISQVAIYSTKAAALHDSALRLIKEAVADRITNITNDMHQSESGSNNSAPLVVPADKLESSIIYTRFHGISSRSNSLLFIIQQRINRPLGRYRELLQQCQIVYCSSRESLLQPSIRKHMLLLKEDHGLVGMTRLASVFLMKVCSSETNLYLDFFGIPPPLDNNDSDVKYRLKQNTYQIVSNNKPSSVLDDEQFQKMLGGLCSNLHRIVRRGVVLLSDMDLLCQVVSVLREERSVANTSALTRAVARSMSRMIEDAQERLIFCTLATLTKEVVKFKPTQADLDYPKKLQFLRLDAKNCTDEGEDAVHAQMQVYESWFPPMRTVLKVLSKLFRVVDPKVFEDIAFQAVQSCTKSLKEAANVIRSTAGEIDGDLFLVKHLLILREQLSPFDIQLRAVERQLDFSEAGKAVTKFLASQNRRIFSMSTENALLTLLREGVSVQEAAIDSKRDLEDALRSSCNDFIDHSSMKLAAPLLQFIDSYKSIVAVTSSLNNKSIPISASTKDHVFMNKMSVCTMIENSKESFQENIVPMKEKICTYLESTAAQSILFKPVIRKIIRAIDDFKCFVSDVEESDYNGWNETTREEVRSGLLELESLVKEVKIGVVQFS